MHPDVERHADADLRQARAEVEGIVSDAVHAAQADGLHPGVNFAVLTLFVNAVPFGVAMLRSQGMFYRSLEIDAREAFIAQVTELVVPVADRETAK